MQFLTCPYFLSSFYSKTTLKRSLYLLIIFLRHSLIKLSFLPLHWEVFVRVISDNWIAGSSKNSQAYSTYQQLIITFFLTDWLPCFFSYLYRLCFLGLLCMILLIPPTSKGWSGQGPGSWMTFLFTP